MVAGETASGRPDERDETRPPSEATRATPSGADDALPSPDDRPDTDVVIFDGNCRLCTRQIAKLPWWDCQHRLSYLSLHDPRVQERFPAWPHERLITEMAVVDRAGKTYWGPAAVRYLARRLRRLWWVTPVLFFPGSMWLWRPLYRWIARNRYRLSGATDCADGACAVHRGTLPDHTAASSQRGPDGTR